MIEVNGTVFSDHTKNSGDLGMFEDILKRSLIFDMIKDDTAGTENDAKKNAKVKDEAPKAPSDGPPVAPVMRRRDKQRRLTKNFMTDLEEKLHAILKALSRTNSGADSYDKVLSLFGLGGSFLVKPAAQRNKPTRIMFSKRTNECIVECYNNYEVIFLDENHSPLVGAEYMLLVETRLVEVLNLVDNDEDGEVGKTRRKYRGSTRVLSITVPSVQMEIVERQLELMAATGDEETAKPRAASFIDDVITASIKPVGENAGDETTTKTTEDVENREESDVVVQSTSSTPPASSGGKRRKFHGRTHRVSWRRGRELEKGVAGATLQQRRMASLRQKLKTKRALEAVNEKKRASANLRIAAAAAAAAARGNIARAKRSVRDGE